MTLSGCGTHKDLVYMQNDTYGQLEEILNLNKIKVQPQDQLSIIVSCKEEELASLVNLTALQRPAVAESRVVWSTQSMNPATSTFHNSGKYISPASPARK